MTGMSPAQIAAELEAIAILIPALLDDPHDFPRAFEELTYGLLARVAPSQESEVLASLRALVEGAGVERPFTSIGLARLEESRA